MEMVHIISRTIFFYFFIMVAYRLMGKREIGQLGIIDLIVSILIAELVAISIENLEDSIFMTIIPIIVLVLLEIIFAYINMKSRRIKSILDGKPSLIIYSGKINYKEMVKQRYCLEDLLIALRQKSVKSIDDVEYAFLEPNGKLSIFKYNLFKLKTTYPMPLIIDGNIHKEALKKILKNEIWLKNELIKNEIQLKDVFYAFYKNKKLYIINKNKLEKESN